MEASKRHKTIILIGVIVLIGLSRLLPHPMNLTPVGAMVIFAGAYLPKNALKYLIPLGVYWISDLIVMHVMYPEYYSSFQLLGSPGVYVALLAIVLFSALVFKSVNRGSYLKWSVPTAVSSSVIFFLVSNFGSWIASPAYPKTVGGLVACYEAGIPFFQNTFSSFVFYTVIVFGLMFLAERKFTFLRATA